MQWGTHTDQQQDTTLKPPAWYGMGPSKDTSPPLSCQDLDKHPVRVFTSAVWFCAVGCGFCRFFWWSVVPSHPMTAQSGSDLTGLETKLKPWPLCRVPRDFPEWCWCARARYPVADLRVCGVFWPFYKYNKSCRNLKMLEMSIGCFVCMQENDWKIRFKWWKINSMTC